MSSEGAIAPITALCSHLIQAGDLHRPFALRITRRETSYSCPICIVDAIGRRLMMPGAEPSEIAQSLNFTMCGHEDGSPDRACWRCLSAITAALTLRWAEASFGDKLHANRLLRVVQLLNLHYDPAHKVSRPSASPRYHEIAAAPTASLTVGERAEQRRTRADVTRIANKRAAIREERSIPETWSLQTKQPDRVVVVPRGA